MAGLAVYGGVFLAALASGFDPDLWWHLGTGQWIALHRSVPRGDFLSFTATGASWLDHEWLAELLTWLCWRAGGPWATLLFYALIITSTFAILGWRMRLRAVPPLISSFMLLGALLACGGSIGMRMQMFSLLMLAGLLLILESVRAGSERRLLLVVPPLLCLWANLHGGFMIGLAVLAIGVCGAVISRRFGHSGPESHAGSLALTLLASTLATLANPNGAAALVYPFRFLKRNPFTSRIAESLPPTFHDPVTITFAVLAALLILGLVISREGSDATDLLLAAAFTVLALSQARNIAVWVVAVLPVTASAVTAALARIPAPKRQTEAIDPRKAALMNRSLLGMVVVAYLLISVNYLGGERLAAQERDHYPRGAMAILEGDHARHHVFADYEWGGYVGWKLGEKGRVFIDGRADTVYSEAILEEYLSIASALPGWQERLRRHGADAILLPPDAPLSRLLVTEAHWELAYADRVSVLYQRSSTPLQPSALPEKTAN